MIQDGTRVSQMVSDGARWYQVGLCTVMVKSEIREGCFSVRLG